MPKENYSEWTKQELIREINKLKKRKKYGIVWEDKPEKVAELCKEKLPVLEEDKSKEIKTDEHKPINILIEGDNYHALSVLNYTHKGKIDVIYIDPPYNTGNKDFIYNDRYVDSEDSYRHSKWLSFMSKRLKLAKNVLSDNGVIFISIDDNELAQLKLLMDEIFGENFISNIIWKSKSGGAADSTYLAVDTEYILVYTKNKDKLKGFVQKPKMDEKEYKYEDEMLQNYGRYKTRNLDESGIRYSVSLDYPIILSKDRAIIEDIEVPLSKDHFLNCEPPEEPITLLPGGKKNYTKKYTWRWKKTKVIEGLKKKYLIFSRKKGRYVLLQKQYQFFDTKEEKMLEVRTTPYRNWIDFTNTTKGTKILNEIFHKKVFDHPKPVDLIEFLINLHPNKNAIVLDFMAGTGTTGHAVLELNKEDGGNRRFILVTNNENNICTDVCYPRIEKVINGYKNLKGEMVEGLGGNLKYFKTAFVDAEPTDENKKKLVDKSTEMLCLKEDCFDFVKEGEYFRIFKNPKDKYLGIVYDDEGIEPIKEEIKNIGMKFVVYVFSLDDSAREEEFEDIKDMVELKPIPAAILNVYRRLFK